MFGPKNELEEKKDSEKTEKDWPENTEDPWFLDPENHNFDDEDKTEQDIATIPEYNQEIDWQLYEDEKENDTKKEDAEIEWDEVIKFTIKNLEVFKKHKDDRAYWDNEGKGKHLEDDLSEEIENWDDLSDEEK